MATTAVRLAIGTVQFGSHYGIANATGRPPVTEVTAILDLARSSGVDTIDTAAAYGESEKILGDIGIAGWRVVSKLPARSDHIGDIADWTESCTATSLSRLGIESLYALLLHHPQDLLSPEGADLYRALQRLKSSGRVLKIGVSIYDPAELDTLLPRFRLDLVQAPFSVVDRRLKTTGWMDRLRDDGVELHTRSAFLQGLLLLPAARRPAAFHRWQPLWAAWDRWLEESEQTALQACLGFVLAHDSIDRVVVGVDTTCQLAELLAAAHPARSMPPAELATNDVDILHPSRWSV